MKTDDAHARRRVPARARLAAVAGGATLLLTAALTGAGQPADALASTESGTFVLHAGGFNTRGDAFTLESSTAITRAGRLTGSTLTDGTADYDVAAGPGVVGATLSGRFSNPAGFTILYAPTVRARASTTLTISGPSEQELITTSLNVQVAGVLDHVCGPTLFSCEGSVQIQLHIFGNSFFTDVSTVNGVTRNTLGLTVAPTADGVRVSGDVTTPPLLVPVNRPFSVTLIVDVTEADWGDGRPSDFSWEHGFDASFARTGTVLNVPGGYEVNGSGVVNNRWQDPFAPPDAVDDSVTVSEGLSATAIDVLANDVDPSGGGLTITGSTAGAHGSVTCSASSCSYTPDPGFAGSDSFSYTVANGRGGTDTANVAITVQRGARLTVALDADPTASADFAYRLQRSDSDVTEIGFLDNDPDSLDPAERTHGPMRAPVDVELQLDTVPDGWRLDAIDCGSTGLFTPLDPVARFTLQPDDDVRCTVRVSRLLARLTVALDAEPDAPDTFAYSLRTSGTDIVQLGFLDEDPDIVFRAEEVHGPMQAPVDVELEFAPPPDGWRLDAIDCGGKGVFNSPDARFPLEPGDDVRCTLRASRTDVTAPTVSCQTPEPVFLLGADPAAVTATVADEGSGPETGTVSAPANTGAVGSKTVALTGRDAAGNETTVECDYRVEYRFDGFSDPVKDPPALTTVTAGRVVPLKWRLTDASQAPITNASHATLTAMTFPCDLGTTPDLGNEQTAGGSGLQNLGDGYYQLNWRAPASYARSCKTLRLDLGEGAFRTALFRLR